MEFLPWNSQNSHWRGLFNNNVEKLLVRALTNFSIRAATVRSYLGIY